MEQPNICFENLGQLHQAASLDTIDHDDALPRASAWTELLRPYVKSERLYTCPTLRRRGGYGYAMNVEVSGKLRSRIREAVNRPLFYDSANRSRNAHDPFTSLPKPPRCRGGNGIVFVDGHVEFRK